ncbi:MAG: hypothetical protein H6Q49_1132 [Deltaproteobacteria bacterium]|nr:hypothetical protein [Deltaproteobacteria bacterium]
MKYYDEESYRFNKNDVSDRCFCCSQTALRYLIVRHIESNMLVHLCPECMMEHSDDYMLDNTRPWLGENGKK